jgi:hypothetical protein
MMKQGNAILQAPVGMVDFSTGHGLPFSCRKPKLKKKTGRDEEERPPLTSRKQA